MSDFDKEVAKIEKYNEPIMEGFQAWLEKANLSAKTIKNHILNIEFFAEYLVSYEPLQKLDEADDQDVYDFLLNALCELRNRMLFKSKHINTKTLIQKNPQSMTGHFSGNMDAETVNLLS